MGISHELRSVLVGFSDDEISQIEDGSLVIYRLFSFERFIDLVRTGKLTLLKPRLWEDPYENPFHRQITERDTGHKLSLPALSNDLFAQCWSLCSESDAMWRIYSHDKRGVLVAANAKLLLKSAKLQFARPLDSLYLGKVKYSSESELKRLFESEAFLKEVMQARTYSSDSVKTLLYKRDPFSHEAEVRLILARRVTDDTHPSLAPIPIDLTGAITNVTLDPRLSEEEFERQSFLIGKSGYCGLIRRSTLYAMPDLSLSIPSLEWLYAQEMPADDT